MKIRKLAVLVLASTVISVLLVIAPNGDKNVARGVLGAIVVYPSAIQRATGADTPRFETADCPFPVTQGERVECGYLIVPEVRNQPNSRTIKLAVAILKSNSANPAPDPIIYLAGGPGASALRTVQMWHTTALRERRDFILLDQRGTGYSEPYMRCPEREDAHSQARNQNLSPEQETALKLEIARQCRDRLLGEGVNLTAYNSAASAADLNDLRLALGYKELNLYGISYGTRLALTVMRDYPQGIRSVILDSARPLQVNLFELNADTTSHAFDVLFKGCASDPACHAAYPAFEKVFYELVARYNSHPLLLTLPDAQGRPPQEWFNGDDVAPGLFNALYDTGLLPFLPLAGYQIYAGNQDVITALAAQPQVQGSTNYGMYYSVECHEEAPFNDPLKVQASWEAYPQLRSYFLRNGSDLATCQLWGASEADPIENEAVRSDIPTLVLAGEYDPVHPPSWSKQAASTLSRSFYYEFPGASHGVTRIRNECPRIIRNRFIDNPISAPDASCIEEMHSPPFVTDVYINPGIYRLATSLLQRPYPVQVGLLAACLLLLVSAITVWPMAYLFGRWRKQPREPSTAVSQHRPSFARVALGLAFLTAALEILFVIALALFIRDAVSANENILLFGLPLVARPLFALPRLAALLTMGVLVFAVSAWKDRYWTATGRAYYSLVALAAVGFIGLLSYWGLLRL